MNEFALVFPSSFNFFVKYLFSRDLISEFQMILPTY